jgi:LacI family transcriptional regulator
MNSHKTGQITIKDIAKALNLSPSSVTRALKGSYKISEETIRKVQAYAEEHHYRPNLMAQSLKNKQSRSIGVLFSSIPNNFFAEVLNGIDSIAASKDYHVLISQTQESFEKEIKELKNFQWKGVDGVLVSLSSETTDLGHFEELMHNGIPVVFFDRVPENVNAYKVEAGEIEGTYQLVKHLLLEGFRKVAHITSSPQLSITKRRLEGYQKALHENDVPANADYIKFCMHGGRDEAEIAQAIDELLNLHEPPDAITTASDRITLKSFAILKSRGVRIPDQMALGGFSNFSSPELFCPSLTTVVQPAFEIGRKAAELLLQVIESKKPVKEFSSFILPTEVIVRGSSRKKIIL